MIEVQIFQVLHDQCFHHAGTKGADSHEHGDKDNGYQENAGNDCTKNIGDGHFNADRNPEPVIPWIMEMRIRIGRTSQKTVSIILTIRVTVVGSFVS